METFPVFCGKDCGGNACPLLAEVENGRVVRVKNNPAGGKYLKGCVRGFDLPRIQYAPERLTVPLVRVGPRGSGQFREASWEEALALTARALGEVREKYGPRSVINLGSAGATGAMHDTSALLSRFLYFYGGYTALKSNYSNGAARFVLPYLLGSQWKRAGFDPSTLQHSQMIILWGANILGTRMGTELTPRLMEARQRGAQVVVIDPRCSPTMKQAGTWWIPIQPGTDAAMMLAVLYVLFTENLVNRDFITAHSAGFDELESYVLGRSDGEACSPLWASSRCGVPVEEIVRFARAYGSARPALLLPGYSIQRVFAGEETYRLSAALQVATGNFGRRGGSTGALNNLLPTPRVGSLPVPEYPDGPSLPVLRWPDAVLEGKNGGYPTDIHAVYSVGGNYLNQGGDVKKNMAALKKVDFSVTHDLFLTPTARFSDVVFPAAGPLEKEDIGIPWMGNYLLYKPQVVPPAGQARSDYDILCDLANRLGFGEAFSEGRTASQWVERFLEESEIKDVEAFRRSGIYLAPEQERVGLADFAADPAGHPLDTPSGKVEIASDFYHQKTGFPAIPTWQEPPFDSSYPLRLITPKSLRFTHSQGQNIPELRNRTPLLLEMNPADAAARGIKDGERVRVTNARGTTHVVVELTDDIACGVVCLPEGAWVQLDPDGEDRGGSANMLTETTGTAPGTACIMHAVGVEVERE